MIFIGDIVKWTGDYDYEYTFDITYDKIWTVTSTGITLPEQIDAIYLYKQITSIFREY